MSEYYSPDNLKEIVPYLPKTPQWLLLGGPADAREAQTARELWPSIKIIGVEPNPEAVRWQQEHGWPQDCPLLQSALSSHVGEERIQNVPGSLRSSRLADLSPDETGTTPTTTWDTLDRLYGPFHNALLWMDIETWEWEALQGAKELLDREAIFLINVEMQARSGHKNHAIDDLLRPYGFTIQHEWNHSPSCWDRVYVRRV